jgi:Protein of unknown function (DUF938)
LQEISQVSLSNLPILNRKPCRMGEGCTGHECARADCPGRFAIAFADRFADGVICINMVHISPWDGTVGLITGAAAILPPGSPLYLCGPYKRKGFATAPSNEAFDRNLRDRNPSWGLRDLETVTAIAQSIGFSVPTVTEMPANNLSVVFRRM